LITVHDGQVTHFTDYTLPGQPRVPVALVCPARKWSDYDR
jgi:hypothetical protein